MPCEAIIGWGKKYVYGFVRLQLILMQSLRMISSVAGELRWNLLSNPVSSAKLLESAKTEDVLVEPCLN